MAGWHYSYLPFSGIVVPGDEIVIADAEKYWDRACLPIQPDFIPTEEADIFMSRKKLQARESNIEVLVKPSFNVVGENNSKIISSTSMVTEGLMITQNLKCNTDLPKKNMLVHVEENVFK